MTSGIIGGGRSSTSLPAILTITESGTGDGNGDGQTDGADIAGFIGAVLDEGATPNSCAYDMDTDGSALVADGSTRDGLGGFALSFFTGGP